MNVRMSHGQAIRSVFGCSRVTHFTWRSSVGIVEPFCDLVASSLGSPPQRTARAWRSVSPSRRCPMAIRARIRRILPFTIAALPFILAACGHGGTPAY